MDYSWIANDPNRSYFGHPYLPAGYDSMAIGAEEVNAPGENWPVWPVYYETFVGFQVVLITEEMLDIFETGHPDYVVPHDTWQVTIPPQESIITMATDWGEQTVAAQNNVITFPHEAQTVEVRKTG